ncbi:hydroxyisourate hydrolase [Luteipulveratus halotolerans]|uniref:5-hydroxyisourate hydrolase n=1 Tax=Luteipulveratus halotolerans TaxID=1631356 RepID=A0A0L6CDT6_9MICO|nr:hydroxyisourate hydrolase [Luteipulveratus halotolerans]KNX36031.1 5-hydroxyisourate hydrolase [Luteipulveratus halotolerans]
MTTLSTHVLDTGLGRPASGVGVTLETVAGQPIWSGETDADGRVSTLGPETLDAGDYRLRFATAPYFAAQGKRTFYPEVVVVFTVDDADAHFHVPVLLNAYGYSTYRGS